MWSPCRLPAEPSVQQLFREWYALEFQGLSVLFHAAIEGEAHLPGASKHLRVLDRGFVREVVRTHGSVAFNHMQRVAMEVPGPVEPGLLAESCHVNNQRIPFPAAARPAHPRIGGSLPLPIHTDAPSGTRELISDQD